MPWVRGVLVALLGLSNLIGCWQQTNSPGDSVRARSLGPTQAGEGLVVHSVLIEQPAGDEFLASGLWESGVAAVVESRKATLLLENGIRTAVICGNPPSRLLSLLSSPVETVNPRGLTFGNRKEEVVPTAGPIDPCQYTVVTGPGSPGRLVTVQQGRAGILVRPEITPDGRVRLWCEPRIQHGERRDQIRPNGDATGFTILGELPVERYPEIGFEVVLAPNDYLVMGWPGDRPRTLGAVLFGVSADGRPRQRVLVIRAGQIGDPRTNNINTHGQTFTGP